MTGIDDFFAVSLPPCLGGNVLGGEICGDNRDIEIRG